jgi:tetratricopeptide (TPR) repeat protein
VEGRERWQALQGRLAAARAAAQRGDRDAALAEVGAALEIDPDFLAAQTLRARLLDNTAPAVSAPAEPPPRPDAASAPRVGPRDVSADGYARFQERAKQRRLDKRVDAARDALRRRELKDAAAALDEVIELDPKRPELLELTEEFAALRRRAATSHRGPLVAAAAAFAATVLGASYVQETPSLLSWPMFAAGALLPIVSPSVSLLADAEPVRASADAVAIDADAARPIALPPPSVPVAAVVARPAVMPLPPPVRSPEIVEPLQPMALPTPPPPQPQVVAAAAVVPTVREEPAVDESALVGKALQRYRLAYQDLNAQSAQDVWPAVNEAALARAFDGLQSQTLTFDACDVRVNGEAASATCRGSARYVPKVGSREPRVEPRTWKFTLRKAGADWKIDTARADR